ncbi:EspG family protein [Actinokineospora alba]|uniref:EspG family protein n=1 Tax=Actinokineospora alba TaxID=504798 RepID=A0A1H0W0N5_9PSEU|nr:ESX secretion-associated protein EspG [Actinokineospora alba]TDP67047.1 ESAT-6 protein secretion system EspG family protein [Actinokineospora alba]SDJ48064.1 EspG family protein [Actinokineospora alba]SDP83936.1 EspG family protein [Actinokineospora alba]
MAEVALHPVEVDLLCVFAEVEAPFPIDVPATGQSDIERGVLFSGAAQQLRDRGLADERGPLDVAEEFVYLLRACTGVVDLVVLSDDRKLAAAVLTAQDEALVVVQDSADPHGMIRLRAATLDNAIGTLERMVPRVDTPLTAPFSLPRRAVESAFEAILAEAPKPLAQNEIEQILAANGLDDRVARRMVSHLQPVLGSGQTGVAKRDDTEDQWRRVGDEVRWIDTTRGRYRLAGDADWMSVNPLGTDDFRAALRAMAGLVRA